MTRQLIPIFNYQNTILRFLRWRDTMDVSGSHQTYLWTMV